MKVEQYLQKRKVVKSDLFIAAMDDKLLTDSKSIVRIVLYPSNFELQKIDILRDLTDGINIK